jgi:Flp pilus assembly protein CpaB
MCSTEDVPMNRVTTGRASPAVRLRRAAARPVLRRLAVTALALVTVVGTATVLGQARAERDRWGTGREVLVARRDLAAGDVIGAGDVERRALPRAALPAGAGALTALPVGAVVRHPVLAGEPVVAARLAPAGLAGAAALVGPDDRAVAVPRAAAPMPPLAVGDLVDVLAVMPPGAGDGHDPPAFPVVERATVVHVGDEAVTVAVPVDDAARTAWAVTQGSAVLALAGG